MGAKQSAFDLAANKIEKNLTGNVLADVIDYQNGEDAINSIVRSTMDNWESRGTNATKENLINLCTAAVSGQGKTELCRQVVLQRKKFIGHLEGVGEMIVIPISFNQFSTFSSSEVSTPPNVEQALIWRIFYAFGYTMNDCRKYTGNLRHLLADIREANSELNKDGEKVGIFLLVDEILKVRATDEFFFKQLLDVITGLQHQELHKELPTFVLITSLELTPVGKQIVTNSGRRIQSIPLPFLLDNDLELVTNGLFEQFAEILQPEDHEHSMLKLVLKLAVHISGRHFRCLEDALSALYQKLVSDEQHIRSKEMGGRLSRVFKKKKRAPTLSLAERADVDISIKSIFDSTLSQVDLGGTSTSDYREAVDLFIRLICKPDLQICEENVYHLEANKVVFVKSRDLSRATHIVPRVNLPFLFFYARLDDDMRYKATRRTDTCNAPSQPYVQLKQPSSLGIWMLSFQTSGPLWRDQSSNCRARLKTLCLTWSSSQWLLDIRSSTTSLWRHSFQMLSSSPGKTKRCPCHPW